MTEMIERVARALCKSERGNPDYVGPGADPNFPAWTKYQLRAISCISAMREPTQAMMADSWDEHQFDRREVWRAMIDIALDQRSSDSNLAAQMPIKVHCKCGWQGSSADLIGRLASNDLYCPKCNALFTAWPRQTIEQS